MSEIKNNKISVGIINLEFHNLFNYLDFQSQPASFIIFIAIEL